MSFTVSALARGSASIEARVGDVGLTLICHAYGTTTTSTVRLSPTQAREVAAALNHCSIEADQ